MPAKRRPKPPRLNGSKSVERVERSIRLLELLSSVEGHVVTSEEARQHLGCTDAELDEYIDLLNTLSNRESGARAAVWRDHGDVVLEGEDAAVAPLRLSMSEGAVLAEVLESLHIDAALRARLEQALIPPVLTQSRPHTFASAVSYGAFYEVLAESISERCRCQIAYRSEHDPAPRERTVDPVSIEATDEAAYLIAYDVEQEGIRRYRLDRIAGVTPQAPGTAQRCSADATHEETDLAQSLAQGELVTLELDPGARIPTWRGIASVEETPKGPVRLTVHVTSESWLFDQVLAHRGALRITDPVDVAARLERYATALLHESL